MHFTNRRFDKIQISNICYFRRRLRAEGAKPQSNNLWKSDLGRICIYIGMYVGGWVGIRASSNMLTGGAIAPAVEQIAPPVTKICPPSESLNFG